MSSQIWRSFCHRAADSGAGSLWSPEAPLAGRVEVEEDVGSSHSGAEAEALRVVDIM